MKRYLIPDKGTFYKANLHCHSTCSDGKLSPEQIKQEYMAKGYSIVAYTDHNCFKDHSELADESFLPICGCEVDITENKSPNFKYLKTYHINLYAPDYSASFSRCDFSFNYSVDCVNEFIRYAKEKGYMVSYNHPRWSLENYSDYSGLEGVDFIEIYNHGCYVAGYEDYVPYVMDDFLRMGKRVWCTATDDNHNHNQFYDSFGGYVMIKAEKLEYGTVMQALKNGEFYASTGAQIDELYIEDGVMTVKCAPAKSIVFTTEMRKTKRIVAKEGQPLTQGTFKIDPDDGYVHVEITDINGYKANTQPYFVK